MKLLLLFFVAFVFADEAVVEVEVDLDLNDLNVDFEDNEFGYAKKSVQPFLDLGQVTNPATNLQQSLKPALDLLKGTKNGQWLEKAAEVVESFKRAVNSRYSELNNAFVLLNSPVKEVREEALAKVKSFERDTLTNFAKLLRTLVKSIRDVNAKLAKAKGDDLDQLQVIHSALSAVTVNVLQTLVNIEEEVNQRVCQSVNGCKQSILEGLEAQVNQVNHELNALVPGSNKAGTTGSLDLTGLLSELISAITGAFNLSAILNGLLPFLPSNGGSTSKLGTPLGIKSEKALTTQHRANIIAISSLHALKLSDLTNRVTANRKRRDPEQIQKTDALAENAVKIWVDLITKGADDKKNSIKKLKETVDNLRKKTRSNKKVQKAKSPKSPSNPKSPTNPKNPKNPKIIKG